MAQTDSVAVMAEVDDIAPEMKALWRSQVVEQRERLFRRNWKNLRQAPALQSRVQEEAFRFVVEWYEEFDEVVGREKERGRLDRLIELGLDVNAPRDDE